MNLTDEQEKQLQLMDELFRFLDEASLRKIIDEHKVMCKLKGTDYPMPSIIVKLRDELNFQESKIMCLESDICSIQGDIKALVEYLHKSAQAVDEQKYNLQTVANRHGVYY